jgi:hypothetical protein
MAEDLDHPDDKVRRLTVAYLRRHPPDLEDALPIYRKALTSRFPEVRRMAGDALTRLGRKLSPEVAVRYEEQVRQEPDDLALRLLMLGHYLLRRFGDEAARRARRAHALRVIERAPGLPVAGSPEVSLFPREDGGDYDRAKGLWLGHVERHPDDTAILGNAASFFTLSDRTLSGQLLRRARSLEPDNPEWSDRLGHLYSLEGIRQSPESRRDWAAMSLAELERAHALSPVDKGPSRVLLGMAEAAFESGDLRKARAYAEQLLEAASRPRIPGSAGNETHIGHLVLGRVALASGDLDAAKHHLLESARTTGSPVLVSFGPKMTLAKELLERGEREAVLSYLELCSGFWKMGNQTGLLPSWIEVVREGGTPGFLANLI